jgi:hypothetical protein
MARSEARTVVDLEVEAEVQDHVLKINDLGPQDPLL